MAQAVPPSAANPGAWITVDGNEAAARIAYGASEVIAIYPITPASPMGELADAWAAERRPNLWGSVPTVVEMQSEAGAAGVVHGALQAGAVATTFTSSQGLLLMLPEMLKIAGELSPGVFHVAARALATHALSIFGDHSDVMTARTTGFALLAAGSVQEAHDLALVAWMATLAGRVPVLHFFDGFRTSHEVNKIRALSDADLRALLDERLVRAHRARALTPDRPVLRGTAQKPDVFFQGREAASPYHAAFPQIVQAAMDRLAARCGRAYRLFDYAGAADAERVVVAMGSGAEVAQAAVERACARGERVGVVKVRLMRPFDKAAFTAALPAAVRAIAVLDRTKEPGASGEPLYLDVVAALAERGLALPRVVGGRYGLGSKELTPAMVASALDELRAAAPRRGFTLGIVDDVSASSLPLPEGSGADDEPDVLRAVLVGLGADGTVGACKSTIHSIGERTERFAQGYFVYDSKKAGAVTVSHLRFSPRPILAPWLIPPGTAGFVACHHPRLLERLDILRWAAPGATLLLNMPLDGRSPEPPSGSAAERRGSSAPIWDRLPRPVQAAIVAKGLRVLALDASRLTREAGLGALVGTVLQACFLRASGLLPPEQARSAVAETIVKSFGRRGDLIVQRNLRAVEAALAELCEVEVGAVGAAARAGNGIAAGAPEFVREVTAELLAGRGDALPVSRLPADGTFPTGTARFEKRGIAAAIPAWDPELCIQCGRCALVCPHAAIRVKACDPACLRGAPPALRSHAFLGQEHRGQAVTIQAAPDDCTGCELCVQVCPAKDKQAPQRKALGMVAREPALADARAAWDFFVALPEVDRAAVVKEQVRECQLLQPLFEFSGACAGCGETPYLKLLSQLFGDRLLIANATGCSSIYGGNLPTTPWAKDAAGRGPAWSNSLFEDAAEYGLGFRLALDAQRRQAERLLRALAPDDVVAAILGAEQSDDAGVAAQRRRVLALRERLDAADPRAQELRALADALVDKSVWVVGGDGWAYDIGFGGLDHVLASGAKVKVLVLDTEVYSNTGGQASKATPRGAVAKFAASGKATAKKDLALLAHGYGHAYVATVAFGASDKQTVRALLEAERHPGPALVVAYCHCIAHGMDMRLGLEHQKAAVESGHWPLWRFDPARHAQGLPPLQLDSRPPRLPFADFAARETRFHALARARPDEARRLQQQAQDDIEKRWRRLEEMAAPAPEHAR